MRTAELTRWPAGTLLARLAPATAQSLLSLGIEQRVPPGRALIREGAAGSHVILVRHGITKVTAATADGRSALLSIRVAGDLIGEMSALSKAPRSATVTMCGDGLIQLVRWREFIPFLGTHPEVAIHLAAMVAERLAWSERQRLDFTSYPVKTRLARILTSMAEAHGHPRGSDALEIGVRLTQPELATMCGAAEISVQKALRELRRANVVSSRYGRITVLDLPALRGGADLCTEAGSAASR
jgi:CRP-like cAMP-binding protein